MRLVAIHLASAPPVAPLLSWTEAPTLYGGSVEVATVQYGGRGGDSMDHKVTGQSWKPVMGTSAERVNKERLRKMAVPLGRALCVGALVFLQ